MSQSAVRALFETRIKAWAEANDYPVAFEEQPFAPPTDPTQAYLRVFLLPAQTRSDDLAGSHRAYTGVVQISILTQRDKGPGEGERIIKLLESLFPVNLQLTSSAITAQVLTPLSAGPTLPDNSRRHIPTSFQYRADTI